MGKKHDYREWGETSLFITFLFGSGSSNHSEMMREKKGVLCTKNKGNCSPHERKKALRQAEQLQLRVPPSKSFGLVGKKKITLNAKRDELVCCVEGGDNWLNFRIVQKGGGNGSNLNRR